MGTTFHSAGTGSSNGISTATIQIAPFALSGTNRNLAVGISVLTNTADNIVSITRGGDTFAQLLRHHANPGFTRVETHLYGSTNEPGLASAALTVTLAYSVIHWVTMFAAVTGGHQTTRLTNAVINPDHAGDAAPVAVTTALNDLVLDWFSGRNMPTTITPGAGQTQRALVTSGADIPGLAGNVSTKPGADFSVDMSGTVAGGTEPYNIMNHFAVNFPAAVVATVPDAPTITASGHAPESIRVLVTPGASDGGSPRTNRHFEFRQTLVGGAWTRESDGTGTTVSYLIRNLTPNTQYDVRVIDQNAIGESVPSTIAVATTPEMADPEALAFIDFANPFPVVTPPLFGGGIVTQADIQHVLRLPTVPLVLELVGGLLLTQQITRHRS